MGSTSQKYNVIPGSDLAWNNNGTSTNDLEDAKIMLTLLLRSVIVAGRLSFYAYFSSFN